MFRYHADRNQHKATNKRLLAASSHFNTLLARTILSRVMLLVW